MISIPIAIVSGLALLVLCAPVIVRSLRTRRRPQFSLGRYMLMMLACAGLLYAGVRWQRVDRFLAMAKPWIATQFLPVNVPRDIARHHPGLPEEHELMVLNYALRNMSTRRERVAAIKILCELRPNDAFSVIFQHAHEETDPEIKAIELRLIGLHRKPETIDFLMECLSDKRLEVRAAAADALGLIHQPPNPTPLLGDFWSEIIGEGPLYLSDPRISLAGLVDIQHVHTAGASRNWPNAFVIPSDPIAVQSSDRDKLENTMLTGESLDEREAAARALVNWPPANYQLRLMEWGVWISDKGEMKLLQSVLDEIPAFVHRTGNPVSSFHDRVNRISEVTKPVIQLTASVPLAIDMEVQIKHGRPWFAYPMPDDFGATAATFYNRYRGNKPIHKEFLAELDNAQVASLENIREGYPWLAPSHRMYGPTSAGMSGGPNGIISLGLRWQSMIVSPQQLPWMQLPDPGPEKQFTWWKDLRAVPCSWVSSRGESERFIYYDGPTLAKAPIAVTLTDRMLTFTRQLMFATESSERFSNDRSDNFKSLPVPDSARGKPRRGMYMEVDSKTSPASWTGTIPDQGVALADPKHTTAVECEAEFIKLLVEQGMTEPEARGMADSWKESFFHAYGRRFIYVLTPEEYYEMCPIMVKPAPTEMVRVGIVLTEF